tara:strand:+ start:2105 stop:2386 length:282 start_codon:yes stop_codon:yes gene_type:complete
MIRDIISFIKMIPEAWRTHRTYAKAERELLRNEAKHGPYVTFLMYFEEALSNDIPDEFLIDMLSQFEEHYTIDKDDKDCQVVLQYIDKYIGDI